MRYNPFRDYDKYGCIKLPGLLYLAVAFLMRSYVIWIVALSDRNDGTSLLNLFYPDRTVFTIALVMAIPALLCAALISLRRIGMPWLVKRLWHNIRLMVALAAMAQLSYALSLGHLSWHNLKHATTTYGILLEMLLLCSVIGYCILNQRFKDVSREFPSEPSTNVIK